MADLVQFLKDRINADEKQIMLLPDYTTADRSALFQWGVEIDLNRRRLLAECAAKRRIIEIHRQEADSGLTMACHVCGNWSLEYSWQGEIGICQTLFALAAVYVGHPDFDPDWLQP